MPARKIADFMNQLDTEFVIGNRRMEGYCIAVFADAIKVLPENKKLAGGPDFVRIFCPPRLFAGFVSQSIDFGGDADLVTMMRLLGGPIKSAKAAKRLCKAAERYIQRAKDLQNDWVLGRETGASLH